MHLGTITVFVTLVLNSFVPKANAGQKLNEQLIRMGERVQSRVTKLRGLPVRKPIRWQITTKQQVRAYIKKSINEQYESGEMQNEGLAMRALGLFPADLDYQSFVVSLLEEQVGGFYDAKTKVFYLADWIAPSSQETIIAHELCHALQDQSFDIARFSERTRGNSDLALARSSVLEGEATAVMILYSMGDSGLNLDMSTIDLDGTLGSLMMGISSVQFPMFGKAPKVFRNSLLFPYLKGLKFVSFGKKYGGWKEIDEVYSHLPSSTEQVIHPEKFFIERDDPTPVDLKFISGLVKKPWEKIYEDVMGEFMTGQLLDVLDDRDEQGRGAAGWDGDKIWVFRDGENLAWVGLWVFDSEKDAVEFAGAFSKTVPLRTPGLELMPIDSTPVMHWTSDIEKNYLVSRLGDRVIVVSGFGSSITLAVSKAAAAKFSIRSKPSGGQ